MKGSIAQLCLVWSFALILGVAVGANLPFILLVVYSILILAPYNF